MNALRSRAAGVAVGLLLDRVCAEPPTRWHPVAWFGTLMGAFEQQVWADRRGPGAVYAAAGLTLGTLAGRVVGCTPAVVAVCVAGAELRRVAGRIEARLLANDLDAARAELPALVGRDPSELDASGISAAVIESLAENCVDAVVAPLCWAVAFGGPGAAAYRAVNTMDAMVGHRSDRYRHFGTAAARLDDAANWVPARIYAALMVGARPTAVTAIAMTVISDAPAHPSPNAGVAEAAMAAVLGVELGGPLWYGPAHQDRPRLGAGRRPLPRDIGSAIAIIDRVEVLALLGLGVVGGAQWLGMYAGAQACHGGSSQDRRGHRGSI